MGPRTTPGSFPCCYSEPRRQTHTEPLEDPRPSCQRLYVFFPLSLSSLSWHWGLAPRLPFSPSFGVLWFDLVLANQYRLLAPNFLPRANKKTISQRGRACTPVPRFCKLRRRGAMRDRERRDGEEVKGGRVSWTAYISLSMKSVDPSYNTRLLSAFVLSL